MHFEVGVRGGFGPLPGRRHASVDLKPELEIPVDGIISFLPGCSLFFFKIEGYFRGGFKAHANLRRTVLKNALLLYLLEYAITGSYTELGVANLRVALLHCVRFLNPDSLSVFKCFISTPPNKYQEWTCSLWCLAKSTNFLEILYSILSGVICSFSI